MLCQPLTHHLLSQHFDNPDHAYVLILSLTFLASNSGPVYALVLAKHNVIQDWRALMGPTNSNVAREQAPESLRAMFGTDGTQNACHGSDSPESARREIKFFFPKMVVEPLPSADEAQVYIKQFIEPTLVKGLTALCKNKPSADKYEAITWLARWLLDNNPNKPQQYAEMELPIDPEMEDRDFVKIYKLYHCHIRIIPKTIP